MGLDTSHGCWHGAYSAFSRWRNKIAEAAGFYVWPVKGGDGVMRDTIMLDWGHLPIGHLDGDWPETPSDPLLVLLTHQDCEGKIVARDAGPLADRLEALLPLLDVDGGGHIGSYREKTETFIAGLRKASASGQDVVFS